MPLPPVQSSSHIAPIFTVSADMGDGAQLGHESVEAVTQQPSSSNTVTTQPTPFTNARATNTSERCCTACLRLVDKPVTCKAAACVLALGAVGTLLGAGTATMVGSDLVKGAMYGYMAGTGAGVPVGCAVQQCHDLYWRAEDAAQIAQASSQNTNAEEGSGEAAGFENPGYQDGSNGEVGGAESGESPAVGFINPGYLEESGDEGGSGEGKTDENEALGATGRTSPVLKFD